MVSAFFAFFKALDPRIWIGIAIALAVAASYGYVYRLGGNGPRAELERLHSEITSAKEAAEREDARRDRATATLITSLEAQRNERAADGLVAWAAYRKLQSAASRPGPAPQPVTEPPRICADPGDNERLSLALEGYRREVRSGLDALWSDAQERRREAGQLLEQAQSQAGELIECKAFAVGVRAINE